MSVMGYGGKKISLKQLAFFVNVAGIKKTGMDVWW